MMKRRNLLWLLAAILCLVIVVVYAVNVACVQSSKRAYTYGSVKAIYAALLTEFDKKNTTLIEILSSADEQWRFLTPEEYDKVIFELAKSHNLDPSPASGQPLLDLWGNRFEIAYRKLPNQAYDVIVVSKGPDGIYGTKDDIVSDYSVTPPVKVDK
jgi:hypothetical protein